MAWATIVGGSLVFLGGTETANANPIPTIGDSDSDDGGSGGDTGTTPPRSTYCDSEGEGFAAMSKPKGYYQYSDDSRSYTYTVGTLSVQVGDRVIEGQTEGAVPEFEEYDIWCEKDGEKTKETTIWVPIATPESVADRWDLLAKVLAQLEPPKVKFVDADYENGWLYVKVDHRMTIDVPADVTESTAESNEWGGYASAWVRADATSLYIDIPGEAGEVYSEKCALADAMSGKGCRIKFAHSSSIASGGVFKVTARLWWTVSSNSGKYDGVGPFETESETEIAVAEAMAVSE